ncbi:MAG TPA: hypothetical protein VHP83_04085 [Aggregatilineaceae bacterium]|nr:hypothetical protein [Aggregatilineaceae bacterium]
MSLSSAPPSVGKTNLLRFLDQERLAPNDPNNPWNRYAPLTAQQGPIIAVNIDPNALLPSLPRDRGEIAANSWPGFELLAHRTGITPQLYPVYHPATAAPDAPSDLADQIARCQERFNNAHPDMTDFEDDLHAHMALRHLETILDAALTGHRLQNTPIRIAYFMDEFERMLDTMPNYFFVALRSIRDRFKYNVMFVTFTRNNLSYLAGSRMNVLEPFIELFNDATIYLRPFGDDDAWRMIEQLEERTVSKQDYGLGLLIRATGGFAGLLRAGFQHVDKIQQLQSQDYNQAVQLAATRLSAEPNIQAECETLLRGLNGEEIATLYQVAAQKPELNAVMVRELMSKSLLAQDPHGTGVRVMPHVLGAYIRNHPTPPPARPPAPPVTLPELS